ncbi:hypothetical protein SAMN05444398_11575 [Roseovarius pacificus]|uniref:Uncharacterized protein n=1 Tax=Roseovarius pacificus TaxID=337701 RepID=A0A1M7IGP2_9RHOB|nr:hypothetical protein [Roseovarius pacificus]GGO61139.1 hypothetical protein GCM10011315_37160 [Roseovarius pacificus]SHM39880.1 hypothetical protein SAMN05444398_11575 [Roseovarius pacificus]
MRGDAFLFDDVWRALGEGEPGRPGTGPEFLDPFGHPLAIAGQDPELIAAEVAYGEVRRARALLPTVRDSNIALVERETNRLIERLGVPDIIRDED